MMTDQENKIHLLSYIKISSRLATYTVIILASTFGLTLLAIVKSLLMEATAHVPLQLEGVLHHTLVTSTIN